MYHDTRILLLLNYYNKHSCMCVVVMTVTLYLKYALYIVVSRTNNRVSRKKHTCRVSSVQNANILDFTSMIFPLLMGRKTAKYDALFEFIAFYSLYYNYYYYCINTTNRENLSLWDVFERIVYILVPM